MKIARTAVLGASTLAGKELLERLGADRSRLGTLALAEGGGEDAVASSVAGEWVVSTPLMDEALEGADLVLCCSGLSDEAQAAVKEAARTAVVIDVAGSLGGKAFDARSGATLASLGHGIHRSAAGSSLLVASLARAAATAGAQGPCIAVVFEPASELGREAVDELWGQAVATLNFQPLPTAVFGRQAVHDVVSPGPEGESVEVRLRREVAELGGGQVALMVVRPGLFHGTGVALRAAVEPAAWRKAMAGEARLSLEPDREGGVSPAVAVAAEQALVGRIEPDGVGGAWAWAAADTLVQGAVGNAVELILAS